MTAAIDLGISTGVGFLVGLAAYLWMWMFRILEPQRFPHARTHVERPRAAEIDLVGRHHGGSVAADLHHHERQRGAAIEAGAAPAEAGGGFVVGFDAVQTGPAQSGNDGGSSGGGDGFVFRHEHSLDGGTTGGHGQ